MSFRQFFRKFSTVPRHQKESKVSPLVRSAFFCFQHFNPLPFFEKNIKSFPNSLKLPPIETDFLNEVLQW